MCFYTSAQVVDVIGTGLLGISTENLDLTPVDNIEKVLLGVVYKDGPLEPVQGDVRFYDADDNINIGFQPIPIVKGPVTNPNMGSFSIAFNTSDAGGVNAVVLDSDDVDGMHSFYAFLYRALTTPSSYSAVTLQDVFYYHNGSADPYVYEIPILTSSVERDITVKVPVTELENDTRIAVIEVTAGTVSATKILKTYNLGNSFNIDPIVLNDVPGDVDKVTVSIFSPLFGEYQDQNGDDIDGDSFFTSGVVVDVEMGLNHCTFTKGFWGNKKGKDCNQVETKDILDALFTAYGDLEIGLPGHSLIIDDTKCVLDFLPGGGKSAVLGDDYDCDNTPPVKKKGQLKNGLLTQTIALGLNMRYDPSLGVLPLKAYFSTSESEDCDPFSDPVDGTSEEFEINEDVVDFLTDKTINGLYELANTALGGGAIGDLSLSEINDAVTAINEGFDECRVLDGIYDESQKSAFAGTVPNNGTGNLSVYPNPVSGNGTIKFVAVEEAMTTVELYNIMGQKVDVLYNQATSAGTHVEVGFNAQNYTKGLYIVYVKNGSTVHKHKLSVLK